jgi:transaldolase
MPTLADLKVKIYADGADRAGIVALNAQPYIRGITTNPTLMRKAGVTDYERFARDVLEVVTTKPVSFEVLADDLPEMGRQARRIASWGRNVYVKIPVTTTRGESAAPLVRELAAEGVQVNVTALMTLAQVRTIAAVLNPALPAVVSIFAGRIADTGSDPVPVMRASREILSGLPRAELLWASVREVLNLVQAEQCGCDIVTVTHDVLAKAARLLGMDHTALSQETVKMFADDARAAGYKL